MACDGDDDVGNGLPVAAVSAAGGGDAVTAAA